VFDYLPYDKGLGIMTSVVLVLLLMHAKQSNLIVCNVCGLYSGHTFVEVSHGKKYPEF